MKYIVISLMFFCPFTSANAQVVINEIAWMGSNNDGTSTQNANDEWIELYNNGDEAVDLSGWSLDADDGSPSIALEGVINAGEFFLLERSDDDSVPSIIADLIYVGALSNSGEILRIKNNEGAIIDTVDGTENWQNIGGDNETKDTAQRISGGWITALPTPKSANINSASSKNENSKPNEENFEPSSSGPPSTPQGSSFSVEPQIFADAGEDRNVAVGADTLFEGRSFGLKKEPLLNARYVWNFGNGEIKEGQNVLHYYQYPGEYVVVLNVSSGEYSASERIIVNAYPAELVISKVEDNFIEIRNESDRETNLSWWRLRSGDKQFIIPKDTIILPNNKLVFSSQVTGLNTNTNEVSLLYPNGIEAVSFEEEEEIKIPQKTIAVKPAASELQQVLPIITKANPNLVTGLPSQETGLPNWEKNTDQTASSANPNLVTNLVTGLPSWGENTEQTASVISTSLNDSNKNSSIFKWLLATFGIVAISAGAIIFMGRSKKKLGDEIEIVE